MLTGLRTARDVPDKNCPETNALLLVRLSRYSRFPMPWPTTTSGSMRSAS
jgi:hypothetical protein